MMNKFGSVTSVYQPIVALDTERIIGYEALSRGKGRARHPELLFRDSYEKGHTIALDFECLRSAVAVLSKLRKRQLLFLNVEPLTMSRTFTDGEEGHRFLMRLEKFKHQVVFELTEGMKARDFHWVKRGVAFLRKIGFQFAIDDVAGVGPKLFQLMSLKPDFLKIDMGLIENLTENHINQKLVTQLVKIAKRNGSLMIAEGVRRRKDLELVREMGIHYAQGFYFARPKSHLQKRVNHTSR